MKIQSSASVVLALLIAACYSSPDSPISAKPGEPFHLGYAQGATVSRAGLTIVFTTLGEDSRCPEGANCVWSGNARVVISISGKEVSLNTDLDPKETIHSGYKVRLIAVQPYPKMNELLNPDDYTISLIVTKDEKQLHN